MGNDSPLFLKKMVKRKKNIEEQEKLKIEEKREQKTRKKKQKKVLHPKKGPFFFIRTWGI